MFPSVRFWGMLLGVLTLTACGCIQKLYAPEVARMDFDSVKERVGSSGFHLIDARYGPDWEKGEKMIAGAVREDPHEMSGWAAKYAKEDVVVDYCT